ncbi:MAG: carbamoyl phosphate synthase large subunit [Candidatus Melainabacteria bacterium]|nr:MAG: carbamoyl phosphate synthase large subunit [Candidatus Melainabacteria bacterium]
MPRRTDISKILIIGSGPIRIGQACEFDYSGTQACQALRQEGFEVVLVNSNPATIMTDPEVAQRTYIEPLTTEFVEAVIARERPQALLPTMGGQTALNIAVNLHEQGILQRNGVELIGATMEAINVAEDRALFRNKMIEIGEPVPRSFIAHSLEEVEEHKNEIPLPCIIRPAFTLGGTGSGAAETYEQLVAACRIGLAASPVSEVLIEESVFGWKEMELEVVRDKKDNFIVVCGIENLDPMGVHTGDSITVAPIQTLSDREYQKLRDAAAKIIRAIGVDCGGSNIQFAVNPANGDYIVIEMNPRVSRSSALASKATGYSIAKVAAKLAVGFTLDELKNEVAGISACFEPSIDYVVTKIPRFNFDKFYGAKDGLGTEMRSVGEVMAVGTTFTESMHKALRSLELNLAGFTETPGRASPDRELLTQRLATPSRYRLTDIATAYAQGWSVEDVQRVSKIDPWFLHNLKEICDNERGARAVIAKIVENFGVKALFKEFEAGLLLRLKREFFSDAQIASFINSAVGREVATEGAIYAFRQRLDLRPVYKAIDTCAGEFPTQTNYLYSTFAPAREEYKADDSQKVVILGSGPNRIGQAIEFDYCCVQASLAIKEQGKKSIIVNCNPETVSTDYDVSDVLYFEPLTLESVSNILAVEKPVGVIVQFGGQTPLNLAEKLEARGFKILGTSVKAIKLAEDRSSFRTVLSELGIRQPEGAIVHTRDEALKAARLLGFPVLLRPSFVLGGKAMHIARSSDHLLELIDSIFAASPDQPLLIDRFLQHAVEVDVDALSDGETTIVAGIMEHIEEAGVHSGDSSCVLPSVSLSEESKSRIIAATEAIAEKLSVKGLMNVQYAIKDGELYVLEVNPRASRTVPFVSKATGVSWAKLATRVIMGEKLSDLKPLIQPVDNGYAVKSVVIPFERFVDAQVCLGPEMRSTGEVMGQGASFEEAYARAQIASGKPLPVNGPVLIAASEHLVSEALSVVDVFRRHGTEVIVTSEVADSFDPMNADAEIIDLTNWRIEDIAAWMKKANVKRVVSLSPFDKLCPVQAKVRRAAVGQAIPLSMTTRDAIGVSQATMTVSKMSLQLKAIQERGAAAPQPQFVGAPAAPVVQLSI